MQRLEVVYCAFGRCLPRLAMALALTAGLGACGSTTTDRGLSGAGIGAAAGTVVGAVTGIGLVGGAVIGAGAGGLTGVLTDAEDIDLGKPFWK